jgi:soluble lytic murein transglycosylase-like protein
VKKTRQQSRRKSSHWFQKSLLAAYVLAIAWTSFTHAAEFRAAQRAIPSPGNLAMEPATAAPRGPWAVRAYVQHAAKASGVNPHVAEWIVAHESRHRPGATGDGGESRGLWQINKEWHPEVSDACAYNVRCSTDWSLERIREGYADEWSTWKYCREKFEDCPF